LWTSNTIQEHYLNTDYVYIIIMKKLREHQKIENHLAKITYILNCINLKETYFFRDYWFLTIFI